MASVTEAELGGLFENFQTSTAIITSLAETWHQQPTTPVAKYNTAAKTIIDGTANIKNITSNRHDILLGQRQNPKKPYPHI